MCIEFLIIGLHLTQLIHYQDEQLQHIIGMPLLHVLGVLIIQIYQSGGVQTNHEYMRLLPLFLVSLEMSELDDLTQMLIIGMYYLRCEYL